MQEKEPEVIVVQEGVPTKTVEIPAGSKVVVEKVITKDTPVDEISVGKIVLMPNWKKILRKYSFIFTTLAFITGLAGFILPYVGFLQPALTESTYGIIMFCLSALAGVSQFIKQSKLNTEVLHISQDSQQESEEDAK